MQARSASTASTSTTIELAPAASATRIPITSTTLSNMLTLATEARKAHLRPIIRQRSRSCQVATLGRRVGQVAQQRVIVKCIEAIGLDGYQILWVVHQYGDAIASGLMLARHPSGSSPIHGEDDASGLESRGLPERRDPAVSACGRLRAHGPGTISA